MKSISDTLEDNERIIYRAAQHWAIFLGPLVVIFIGCLMLGSKTFQASVVLAFGFIWGILSYFSFRESGITVTDRRLLINIGFPIKKNYNIPLNNIILVDFYQPSLGSILNFGKIILVQKENKKKAFRFISSPAELVMEVHKQVTILKECKKPAAAKHKEKRIQTKKSSV
jgi:hypothetical protein